MNKTRTFLLSGLVTLAFVGTGLTLEKDGEQVLIPLGEWVVVSSAYEPSASVGGYLIGVTRGAIRIQENSQSIERELPISEIGSIFIGKTRSVKDYVWGGVKFGGLIAAGGGLIFGVTCRGLPDGLLVGGQIGLLYSIITVPGGALVGYMRGKVAEGKAVEYVIGPGEWEIVK